MSLEEEEAKQYPLSVYREMGEAPITSANSDLSNCVMLDGLPIISESDKTKCTKLKTVIWDMFGAGVEEKVFSQRVEIPFVDGKSVGVAFVEYPHADQAKKVCLHRAKQRLGNSPYVIRATSLTELDSIMKTPKEFTFVPPKKEEVERQTQLYSWMADKRLRDQFFVQGQNDTDMMVYWHDPLSLNREESRDAAYKVTGNPKALPNSIGPAQWSESGAYLLTFHNPGIMLWGGDTFKELLRLEHRGVRCASFSPGDDYLVTWNPPMNNNLKSVIKVWNVLTGILMREFDYKPRIGSDRKRIQEACDRWPLVRWSHDARYCSMVERKFNSKKQQYSDRINVYEVPSMMLMGKKSIKMDGVGDVQWSPTDNTLACWMKGALSTGRRAEAKLLSIPDREVVRSSILISVEKIQLHWHSQGRYLCVLAERFKNRKTYMGTVFQIFRAQEKNIPVDALEVTDKVLDFQWVPQRNRFGIIHVPEKLPPSVSFYQVEKKKVALKRTLENKCYNRLYFSPAGQACVLGTNTRGINKSADVTLTEGQVEFIDLKSFAVYAKREHQKFNEVLWEPAGRYVMSVASTVSSGRHMGPMINTGYQMYNFQGKVLATVRVEECRGVSWRPRPKNLLTADEKRQVQKNLKTTYWKRFDEEDRLAMSLRDSSAASERKEMLEDWIDFRQRCHEWLRNTLTEREEILGKSLRGQDDSEFIYEEREVEEVLEEKTEVSEIRK